MSSENVQSVSSTAAARSVRDVARELRGLVQSPPEGIRLLLTGDDADCISSVHAEIDGPVGTPYEGGVFRIRMEFGSDFPHQPPKGSFLTRIFHPNIAKTGEICVNTLKRDWKPTLGLRHVLLVIRCLLIEPYPESALNEEAGKLLLEDYSEYAQHARLMTSIHAVPKVARAPAAAPLAEQPQPQLVGNNASGAQGKDSARGPCAGGGHPLAGQGIGAVPGSGLGGIENSGAIAPGPAPLSLNSSIANADGEGVGSQSTGQGKALDGSRGTLGQADGGTGVDGQGAASGKGKVEKKKVDVRKKALKRL